MLIPDKLKTSIFFAKYKIWNRKAIEYFNQLQKNQHISTDELENLNWNKRKKLLAYAHENVPYYRNKFKSMHLHPNDIKKPEDYQNIPLLKRDDLRNNFSNLFSETINHKHLRLSSTGGSTGQPVKVMFDKRVPLEAMGWRVYSWWGLSPGLNSALIWRDMRTKLFSKVVNQALWWPALRITLDASSITPSRVHKFIKRFNMIRPRILHGYVGSLDYIAGYIEQNKITVVSPAAISVTSSPVTTIQRRRIEKAFKCPVYDQYGTCEIFWLASQCGTCKYLHRYHDIRHIEFVNESGRNVSDGKIGDIVITDLENYGFPLIRYLIGDRGSSISEKCLCGINLPLMDQVRGRTTDLIKLPDGSCLSGDYLTTLFDNYPDVVNGFQVRQAKDFSVKITYIPNLKASGLEKALTNICSNLSVKTNFQVTISTEAVDVISCDKGKLRFIISEIE